MTTLITRLRELSGKATKGPWESAAWAPPGDGATECHLLIGEYEPLPIGFNHDPEDAANCDLIAELRNNIDKLLDVVEAARQLDFKDRFDDRNKDW